jgi:hypothetical protein
MCRSSDHASLVVPLISAFAFARCILHVTLLMDLHDACSKWPLVSVVNWTLAKNLIPNIYFIQSISVNQPTL